MNIYVRIKNSVGSKCDICGKIATYVRGSVNSPRYRCDKCYQLEPEKFRVSKQSKTEDEQVLYTVCNGCNSEMIPSTFKFCKTCRKQFGQHIRDMEDKRRKLILNNIPETRRNDIYFNSRYGVYVKKDN